MVTGNTQSTDALRKEAWAKELYADVMANLYFVENGMMGEDENNIVQIKNELVKGQGDTVTLGLTAKLSGDGVTGDSELEGQEEIINPYSESISISLKRNAVRLAGLLDEQKNAYNMRADAKAKLKIWATEFLERQFFLKLGGVTNTLLNDVNGTTVGASCAWSNTPTVIPTADEAYTGNKYRYLSASAATMASLAATDVLTLSVLSKAKYKAKVATPKILPLRIKGKDYYVVFVHPLQALDLKLSANWQQAQREAEARGKDNPIFTGALGVWDGMIIHEHEFTPFLDISVAGYSFQGAATGTVYAVDACRALLCGRQAVAYVKCNYPAGWVEKKFDYDNQTGFSTGIMGGIDKVMFNSKEYGVIAIDSGFTAQ